MRGKQGYQAITTSAIRNIPAYAGKTTSGSAGRQTWKEHPRVCGENQSLGRGDAACFGTSPRMRGKPAPWPVQTFQMRNIPAYAGKTHTHEILTKHSMEHPRVCGENCYSFSWGLLNPGTSPRMRGKPSAWVYPSCGIRNIPAYAGKTMCETSKMLVFTEHPRVCGENGVLCSCEALPIGTSPRMRGKQA